jgi:transposase InsO family protein
VVDLYFGQLYAFFVVEHATRRVVHFGVTRPPTDEGTAQQLREATVLGGGPKYLIRDNDTKFGPIFQKVADDTSIKLLKTPVEAPKANSICERFVGSVRREALDHLLIVSERPLSRILKAYVEYFNHSRPHQGIEQAIPPPKQNDAPLDGKVISFPVMGGLHHHYERVA